MSEDMSEKRVRKYVTTGAQKKRQNRLSDEMSEEMSEERSRYHQPALLLLVPARFYTSASSFIFLGHHVLHLTTLFLSFPVFFPLFSSLHSQHFCSATFFGVLFLLQLWGPTLLATNAALQLSRSA